jgi:hypothetical protein
MQTYTTAKILTAMQEITGLGLAVIGGTVAAIAFSKGASLQSYALPGTALIIGLTLTAAAQLTRAMIATAENTAKMLHIMQGQAHQKPTTIPNAAPPLRAEPKINLR